MRPDRKSDGEKRMDSPSISMVDVSAWLAASAVDLDEGVLALDEAGTILLCNEGMNRIFGLRSSPLGLPFAEAFGREGRLGGCYSESFFDAVTGKNTGAVPDIRLEKPAGPESYGLVMLRAPVGGGRLTVCLVKRAVGLPPGGSPAGSTRGEEERGEEKLHTQIAELVRANAQLRMLNAERSAVTQTLRRAESRYRDIVDNAMEGFFQWTPNWRLLLANRAFAKILGYDTVNELMRSAGDVSFHFSLSPEAGQTLMDELERKEHIIGYEFQVARRDGVVLWASMSARRVTGPGGRTKYYEAFIENISGRRIAEEKLTYQAFHDHLTGLANRALFRDRLGMALRRTARQPECRFAVLTLDLDRFKQVNENFGHSAGDEVLCHVAVSLLSCVRDTDTVARLGEDEFAVFLEETESNSFAFRVSRRIQAALERPFLVKGREIGVSASIGIVLNAEKYESAEDILRDAGIALNRAKTDRGICYKVFTQKMRMAMQGGIVFETELRQGLNSQEFRMNYQPIVRMEDGGLFGFEALLRWHHNGKVISPSRFIPVAEDSGLIRKLGLFAIECVCRQLVEWQQRHAVSFVTHLNISARQLVFPGFPKDVRRIIDRAGVDPSLLVFEITESALLEQSEACLRGIQQIYELGVRFCLDDFGTGFSSLSYLRQLPLSCMKVDRSFVTDVETNSQSLIIVRNLVGLGRELGLSVVVEGVERYSQVQALLDVGCSLGQGYYFSPPLPPREAEKLL